MLPYIKCLPAGTKAELQSCICYLSQLQHCEGLLKACSTTCCCLILLMLHRHRHCVPHTHAAAELCLIMPHVNTKCTHDSNAAKLLGCYSGHAVVPRRAPTARTQAMRSHLVTVQRELAYSRCSTRFTTLSAAHVSSSLKSLSGLPLHACAEQSSCWSMTKRFSCLAHALPICLI